MKRSAASHPPGGSSSLPHSPPMFGVMNAMEREPVEGSFAAVEAGGAATDAGHDCAAPARSASAPPAAGRCRLWRRLAVAAVLLAGLAGLAFVAGFLVFTTQIAAREPVVVRSADAIVVLTGGASRIADAVGLLAEGRGQRLLITGVNPATTPGELKRTLPEGDELLTCCIDLGHKALNTRGNALEAAEWARSQRFRSLVVVTSAWHMPRALVELNRVLPEVDLVAYPVVTSRMEAEQWWRDPSTLKLLFKEYLKYMMAKAKIRPAQAVAVTAAGPAPAEARIAR